MASFQSITTDTTEVDNYSPTWTDFSSASPSPRLPSPSPSPTYRSPAEAKASARNIFLFGSPFGSPADSECEQFGNTRPRSALEDGRLHQRTRRRDDEGMPDLTKLGISR